MSEKLRNSLPSLNKNTIVTIAIVLLTLDIPISVLFRHIQTKIKAMESTNKELVDRQKELSEPQKTLRTTLGKHLKNINNKKPEVNYKSKSLGNTKKTDPKENNAEEKNIPDLNPKPEKKENVNAVEKKLEEIPLMKENISEQEIIFHAFQDDKIQDYKVDKISIAYHFGIFFNNNKVLVEYFHSGNKNSYLKVDENQRIVYFLNDGIDKRYLSDIINQSEKRALLLNAYLVTKKNR